MSNKVCIIIPTFNSWEITANTVKKLLYEQTYKDFDIIIVDAGSKDYEKLKEIFKDEKRVIIIHTDKDLGGAGSFWLGMKYAYESGYDIFILSDNDAIPISNNLIEELVKIAKNKKVAVFPYNVDNDIWEEFPSHAPFHFLTIPKKIVEKVGFPDPLFFIWGDDTEYTTRISKLHRLQHVKNKICGYRHPITWYGLTTFLNPRYQHAIRNNFIRFLKHYKEKFIILFLLWWEISLVYSLIFKSPIFLKRILFVVLEILTGMRKIVNINNKIYNKFQYKCKNILKILNGKQNKIIVIKQREEFKALKKIPKIIGKVILLDKSIAPVIFLPFVKILFIKDDKLCLSYKPTIFCRIFIILLSILWIINGLLICILLLNPIIIKKYEKRVQSFVKDISYTVIKM